MKSFVGIVYSYLSRLREAYKLAHIRREYGGGDRFTYTLQCGMKVDLRFNDHVAQRLLLFGVFEPAVTAAIFALVRPGMTVLDVGANIGIHTLHLAKLVRESGRVIAFEPNAVAREELQRNLVLNNINNVTVLDIALWDQDGERPFRFPNNGMEAMGGMLDTRRFKVARVAPVKTAKLDTILGRLGIGKIDFAKLDVEGAELVVLRGADMLLNVADHPPILYESALDNTIFYSYTPDDLVQFFSSKGYLIESIDKENYLAMPY